jgi:hypothetical protein
LPKLPATAGLFSKSVAGPKFVQIAGMPAGIEGIGVVVPVAEVEGVSGIKVPVAMGVGNAVGDAVADAVGDAVADAVGDADGDAVADVVGVLLVADGTIETANPIAEAVSAVGSATCVAPDAVTAKNPALVTLVSD